MTMIAGGSRSVPGTRTLAPARSSTRTTEPVPPVETHQPVTHFRDQHRETIMAVADVSIVGLQIACMLIPGLQPIALGLALVSAVRAATVLDRGIREQRADLVVEGSIGLVTSFAAGIAGLGAKIAGQGLLAASALVGRGARVADRVMAFARAMRDRDQVAYLFGPAEILIAASGFGGPKLEALAGRLAGYAGTLKGLADALGRVQRGLTFHSTFAAGITGARLTGMVVADLAARTEIEASSRQAEELAGTIKRGVEAAASLPPLVLGAGVLGVAAIGARFWQLPPSERLLVAEGLAQSRFAWETGDFGTAKKAAAVALGAGLGWPPGEAGRISDQNWADWLTLLAAVSASAAQNSLDASTNALGAYMRQILAPQSPGAKAGI